MADFITASICLDKIPREAIKVADNGLKYVSIVIAEGREVDPYGNTHYITLSQTKEQRESKEKRVYIGNGKAYQPQAAAPTKKAEVTITPDYLPF